jgi:hypothetical protein
MSALRELTDYGKRLWVIASGLFEVCYKRVARGMLHEDRVVFAMLLSRYSGMTLQYYMEPFLKVNAFRIYLKGLKQDNSLEEEFQHLLRGVQVIRCPTPYCGLYSTLMSFIE